MNGWMGQLAQHIDVALGLMLSVVLGSVIGFVAPHPLGHVLFGSAMGVTLLVIYIASYSLGVVWLMGLQQGLLIVSAFIWCMLLSSWLGPHPGVTSALGLF